MPDALEHPRVLSAVVELMRRQRPTGLFRFVVDELIALALGHAALAFELLGLASWRAPGFSTVVGALDDLTKPAAGLRCVDAIRIDWRALHVIDLPAREVRP